MQKVRDIEHSHFFPLVFTCAGGIAPKCSTNLNRLAVLISEKRSIHLSQVCGWLRVRMNFALLKSTILCCRGTLAKKFHGEINTELAIRAACVDR